MEPIRSVRNGVVGCGASLPRSPSSIMLPSPILPSARLSPNSAFLSVTQEVTSFMRQQDVQHWTDASPGAASNQYTSGSFQLPGEVALSK